MIIDFSVSNFRSIKEEITFSFETGAHVKKYSQNVLVHHGKKLLKSAVLFGANGSGKSNVLMSLRHLQSIVSFDSNKIDSKLPYRPFIFDKESKEKVSYFRIKFMIGKDVYEYEISHNRFQIAHEKLLINGKLYFDRKEGVMPNNLKESFCKIRPNKSMIFHGQDINDEVCKKVYLWFVDNIIDGAACKISQLINILKDEKNKKKFLDFLHYADTRITDVQIFKPFISKEVIDYLKETSNLGDFTDESLLLKYDIDNQYLPFKDESIGTKKLILFVLILLASNNNKIIIFDDFDMSFHQSIIETLMKLINHPKAKNQYILTAHQINIMDCDLRRDQIWITDKNIDQATTVNSIFDFEIRTDTKFSSQYLKDRFGGMPITDYDKITKILF